MKQHILLEIEDNKGNTKHLIAIELKNKKINKFKCDTLELADEEFNKEFQHLRLQEVKDE